VVLVEVATNVWAICPNRVHLRLGGDGGGIDPGTLPAGALDVYRKNVQGAAMITNSAHCRQTKALQQLHPCDGVGACAKID